MPNNRYEYDGVEVPPPSPTNKGGHVEDIPPLKPNSWMWLSVLVTLCCLPIFGIVGIVYSMQVNPAYYAGNYERAEHLSRRARMWALLGLVLGIITNIVMFITMMKGGVLSDITQIIGDGDYSIYNY